MAMWFGEKLVFNSLPGSPRKAQVLSDDKGQDANFPSLVAQELYGDAGKPVRFLSRAPGQIVVELDWPSLQDQWKKFYDPIAPSPAVELDFKEISRAQGQRGYFLWKGQFILKNATELTNGFLVQKVTATLFEDVPGSEDADGNIRIKSDLDIYWEAWLVRKGVILNTAETGPSLGDQFELEGSPGVRGTNIMTGEAKYVDGYAVPFRWPKKAIKYSPLRTTTTAPADWTASGTLRRTAAVMEYDDRGGKDRNSPLVVEVVKKVP
jgi:hypothetical protein